VRARILFLSLSLSLSFFLSLSFSPVLVIVIEFDVDFGKLNKIFLQFYNALHLITIIEGCFAVQLKSIMTMN